MKISTISITLLIAFITFQSHTMENTVKSPRKSSPTLMQRFFSFSQNTLATKFLATVALMLSNDVMGHSTSTSTTLPVPNLITTPFKYQFTDAAVNPIKPEVALGGVMAGENGVIALVNVNIPSEPELIEYYQRIITLVYNPQGDLLLFATCINPECTYQDLAVLNLTDKTVLANTCKKISMASNMLFSDDGTTVIVRGFDKPSSQRTQVIIWPIANEKPTFYPELCCTDHFNIYLGQHQNTFVMNMIDNTYVWHIDTPSKREQLDIGSGNRTVIGENETQLAYFCDDFALSCNQIIYLKDGRTVTPVPLKDGLINTLVYCQKLEQYLLTSRKNASSLFDANLVYGLNPKTHSMEKLYNIAPTTNLYLNDPTFDPNGCKLFVLDGINDTAVQFYYVDFGSQNNVDN